MFDVLGFDNPIIWAQLRLRRGWKNILIMTATIGLIIFFLIGVSFYLERDPRGRTEMVTFWVGALLSLQIFTLVIGGIAAVYGSVRKDINSGIIESHRLMRVSPLRAVIGYVIGSQLMVMPVAIMTFIIGAAIISDSTWSARGWVLAHLILLIFAIVVWMATLLFALYGKMAAWVPFVLVAACAAGASLVLSVLPGILVLISPIIDWSIFGILESTTRFDERYLFCMGIQVALAVLLFIAAVRKYRRDDVRSFGVLLGLLLVAWWIFASAVGILNWSLFVPRWPRPELFDVTTRLICALLVATILGLVPIAAACYQHGQWRLRRHLRDPALGVRPVTPGLVVACVLVIELSLIWLLSGEFKYTLEPWTPAAQTALVLGAFLLGMSYLIRMLYERQRRIVMIICLWAFALCTGPFMVDGIRATVEGFEYEDEIVSAISGFSPIAQLMFAWDDWDVSAIPGLVGQVFIAVALGGLYHATRRRYEEIVPPPVETPLPASD